MAIVRMLEGSGPHFETKSASKQGSPVPKALVPGSLCGTGACGDDYFPVHTDGRFGTRVPKL